MSDDWYDREESTRLGLISELQRIKRRTRVRPLPVILLAALLTGAIVYKVSTKKPLFEAEIVLSLQQGILSERKVAIPVDQLREYVTGVLMPDNKLIAMIERRNLYRLRKKLGNDFAVESLREQLEVQIWKNSFIYYDEEDEDTLKSARIGITITDGDPDLAFDIARDLAGIVMQTAGELKQKAADEATRAVRAGRAALDKRDSDLTTSLSLKQTALATAEALDKKELVQALKLDIFNLDTQIKSVELRLNNFAASNEGLASRIAAAGLDMQISIVEEHHPERPPPNNLVLIMLAFVVGTFALLGSALVLGAFDSRVHDADDVTRLGLPFLGHVPGFPGDTVGSLAARGAARSRVPSFLRWR